MLETKTLASLPQLIDNVFHSIYSEWGNNNPKFWRDWIMSSMNFDCIPCTFVVLKDNVYGDFSRSKNILSSIYNARSI